MNSELEKLIDLILEDGQITEKERSVIFKKAKESNFDIDELEILLDARLQKQNKKFTNCGYELESFSYKCVCGHEYSASNNSQNSIINRFNEGLNHIPKTLTGTSSGCPDCSKLNIITGDYDYILCYNCNAEFSTKLITKIDDVEKQFQYISNFNIPNDKENNLEFLFYLVSKIKSLENDNTNNGVKFKNTYIAKSEEIILRLRLMFKDDVNYQNIINQVELKINKSADTVINDKIENNKTSKKGFWYYIFYTISAIIVLYYYLVFKRSH
jgi:hypothetical protein